MSSPIDLTAYGSASANPSNFLGIGGQGGAVGQQLLNEGYNSQANLTNQQGILQQQQMLAKMQQAQAAGLGPSAAQAQLNAGTQAAVAGNLAAAGATRAGVAPGAAAAAAGNVAAGQESAAANQAAQLKAQEMQAGSTNLGNTLANANQTAAGMTSAQQAAQAPIAGVYGQEEGQTGGLASNVFSSLLNAGGGIAAKAVGGAAKGGVVRGKTYLGERGPEIDMPPHGSAKLIDHPMLTKMAPGHIVLPLKKGSAPYKAGPLPSHETKGPSRPAPKKIALHPEALAALSGTKAPAPKQRGISPLSPKNAPVVASAMKKHGMKAGGLNEPPKQLEQLMKDMQKLMKKRAA